MGRWGDEENNILLLAYSLPSVRLLVFFLLPSSFFLRALRVFVVHLIHILLVGREYLFLIPYSLFPLPK
jgi:hypothetical protein